MQFLTTILLPVFSFSAYHVYNRIQLLRSVAGNAPGKFQPFSAFPSYEIKFTKQIRNCEDGVLLEDSPGWAVLACDPGRDKWNSVMGIFEDDGKLPQGTLYLYNYASATASPVPISLLDFPGASDFHTVGMEYHAPSRQLFVVNHAVGGSRIEVFRLFASEESATHIRSISSPSLRSPNAIAVLDEDNLLVTNDHYFLVRYTRLLAMAETYLGLPLGYVAHVHVPTTTVTVLARLVYPNGIARINSTTLAVSSTAGFRVQFYEFDPKHPAASLVYKTSVSVPCLPDNLSVDEDGVLLITGHGNTGAIFDFAKARKDCNFAAAEGGADPGSEKQRTACAKRSSTWLGEWTEKGGLKRVYLDDKFSTGCTARRDVQAGIGFVTGLYDWGLLVWKEK